RERCGWAGQQPHCREEEKAQHRKDGLNRPIGAWELQGTVGDMDQSEGKIKQGEDELEPPRPDPRQVCPVNLGKDGLRLRCPNLHATHMSRKGLDNAWPVASIGITKTKKACLMMRCRELRQVEDFRDTDETHARCVHSKGRNECIQRRAWFRIT